MRRLSLAVAVLLALPAAASAQLSTTAPAREQEPVVLTGAQMGSWSVPANQTARPPLFDLVDPGSDPHNHYADPTVDTAGVQPSGTPVSELLGYRYDARRRRFTQIPFQVDEQFTRYLDNSASGFSPYSGEDQHTTYAFDREGFRYSDGQCTAQPASAVATDPVKGLDGNDELAFMASDAGDRAPQGTRLPAGVAGSREVAVSDPTGGGATRYAYVMKAGPHGPRAAFDASNGYVRYQRDADADRFALSQSTYSSYGNAETGPYCDAQGNVIGTGRRRPLDTATVTTPRYSYRYDGRWLMTGISISPGDDWTYGPSLVDRFKARAFAQDPGSKTPCCGYEEEDTNWGGSSTLLGERTGPVRAIRETWGADSGTNVVRRETFYRDEMKQRTWLRVHVIPPLDGIYAQWDYAAGRVSRFYNTKNPGGVAIDGRNDDVFNLDDPCNSRYDQNDTSMLDQGYRTLVQSTGLCRVSPYHLSLDPGDPSFAQANAALGWSEVAGSSGTIVDRISAAVDQATPGGAAQSVVAVPYYRDDSCFDDGTGHDPGPKVDLRSGDEPATAADGTPRRCWRPEDGLPNGSDHFYQGSIGTHGLHLLFLAESDNARQTVPVDEIVSDWTMVMLPGDQGNVGERYGRSFEHPLVATTGGGGELPAGP